MDVRPLLAQRRAPPRDGANLWRAFAAVALLQFATLAAVLASRTAPDGRRQLLADELEPPFRKIREDHDLGADERRRLSGALWGLKTVTTATTLTKFMGTMVLCDTSSAAITVTLPAASDMAEQSGASLRHYKFINTGSNDCTIARAGSDTIVTSTLTATFSGGATTSTFTGTAFTPAGTAPQPTFTGTQPRPREHLGNRPAGTNDAATFTPEGTPPVHAQCGTISQLRWVPGTDTHQRSHWARMAGHLVVQLTPQILAVCSPGGRYRVITPRLLDGDSGRDYHGHRVHWGGRHGDHETRGRRRHRGTEMTSAKA